MQKNVSNILQEDYNNCKFLVYKKYRTSFIKKVTKAHEIVALHIRRKCSIKENTFFVAKEKNLYEIFLSIIR